MLSSMMIGTYTEPILFGTGEIFQGKGRGVYFCEPEREGLRVLNIATCGNPSFLCFDRKKDMVYAVNEMKEFQHAFGGGVTRISMRDGEPRILQAEGTGGTDPCHIDISPDGTLLAVANFASGGVTVFTRGSEGELLDRNVFIHEGSGPDPVRQKGPHAHAVIFSRSVPMMFVPDLGIDALKAYWAGNGNVEPAPEYDVELPPGSGPRSGIFSRDERFFYLICELSSQIFVFSFDKGRMNLLQQAEVLPEAARRSGSICADLHLTPDGRFLYASNRGDDSICRFAVGKDGRLELLGHTPCGGRTPRNFAVAPDGKRLWVGNQDSDNIAVFSIGKDGSLMLSETIPFPSPVCIRFLEEEETDE